MERVRYKDVLGKLILEDAKEYVKELERTSKLIQAIKIDMESKITSIEKGEKGYSEIAQELVKLNDMILNLLASAVLFTGHLQHFIDKYLREA